MFFGGDKNIGSGIAEELFSNAKITFVVTSIICVAEVNPALLKGVSIDTTSFILITFVQVLLITYITVVYYPTFA